MQIYTGQTHAGQSTVPQFGIRLWPKRSDKKADQNSVIWPKDEKPKTPIDYKTGLRRAGAASLAAVILGGGFQAVNDKILPHVYKTPIAERQQAADDIQAALDSLLAYHEYQQGQVLTADNRAELHERFLNYMQQMMESVDSTDFRVDVLVQRLANDAQLTVQEKEYTDRLIQQALDGGFMDDSPKVFDMWFSNVAKNHITDLEYAKGLRESMNRSLSDIEQARFMNSTAEQVTSGGAAAAAILLTLSLIAPSGRKKMKPE